LSQTTFKKGWTKIALLEKVLQNLPTFWKKVEPKIKPTFLKKVEPKIKPTFKKG
jgi:hypothetical protein